MNAVDCKRSSVQLTKPVPCPAVEDSPSPRWSALSFWRGGYQEFTISHKVVPRIYRQLGLGRIFRYCGPIYRVSKNPSHPSLSAPSLLQSCQLRDSDTAPASPTTLIFKSLFRITIRPTSGLSPPKESLAPRGTFTRFRPSSQTRRNVGVLYIGIEETFLRGAPSTVTERVRLQPASLTVHPACLLPRLVGFGSLPANLHRLTTRPGPLNCHPSPH